MSPINPFSQSQRLLANFQPKPAQSDRNENTTKNTLPVHLKYKSRTEYNNTSKKPIYNQCINPSSNYSSRPATAAFNDHTLNQYNHTQTDINKENLVNTDQINQQINSAGSIHDVSNATFPSYSTRSSRISSGSAARQERDKREDNTRYASADTKALASNEQVVVDAELLIQRQTQQAEQLVDEQAELLRQQQLHDDDIIEQQRIQVEQDELYYQQRNSELFSNAALLNDIVLCEHIIDSHTINIIAEQLQSYCTSQQMQIFIQQIHSMIQFGDLCYIPVVNHNVVYTITNYMIDYINRYNKYISYIVQLIDSNQMIPDITLENATQMFNSTKAYFQLHTYIWQLHIDNERFDNIVEWIDCITILYNNAMTQQQFNRAAIYSYITDKAQPYQLIVLPSIQLPHTAQLNPAPYNICQISVILDKLIRLCNNQLNCAILYIQQIHYYHQFDTLNSIEHKPVTYKTVDDLFVAVASIHQQSQEYMNQFTTWLSDTSNTNVADQLRHELSLMSSMSTIIIDKGINAAQLPLIQSNMQYSNVYLVTREQLIDYIKQQDIILNSLRVELYHTMTSAEYSALFSGPSIQSSIAVQHIEPLLLQHNCNAELCVPYIHTIHVTIHDGIIPAYDSVVALIQDVISLHTTVDTYKQMICQSINSYVQSTNILHCTIHHVHHILTRCEIQYGTALYTQHHTQIDTLQLPIMCHSIVLHTNLSSMIQHCTPATYHLLLYGSMCLHTIDSCSIVNPTIDDICRIDSYHQYTASIQPVTHTLCEINDVNVLYDTQNHADMLQYNQRQQLYEYYAYILHRYDTTHCNELSHSIHRQLPLIDILYELIHDSTAVLTTLQHSINAVNQTRLHHIQLNSLEMSHVRDCLMNRYSIAEGSIDNRLCQLMITSAEQCVTELYKHYHSNSPSITLHILNRLAEYNGAKNYKTCDDINNAISTYALQLLTHKQDSLQLCHEQFITINNEHMASHHIDQLYYRLNYSYQWMNKRIGLIQHVNFTHVELLCTYITSLREPIPSSCTTATDVQQSIDTTQHDDHVNPNNRITIEKTVDLSTDVNHAAVVDTVINQLMVQISMIWMDDYIQLNITST